MNIDLYNSENWRDLLDKDWQYLKQDTASGNVERLIEKISREYLYTFVYNLLSGGAERKQL